MTQLLCGRFAPTPSGPLHFGSLITALASYLSIKKKGGRWLVRIEDIDGERTVLGSAADILRTLEACGLEWDKDVVYQSQRTELYEHVVKVLLSQGQAYRCSCSRREIGEGLGRGIDGTIIYPRFCAGNPRYVERAKSVRLATQSTEICFRDRVFGNQCQNVEKEVGDFVIKRSDGFFAYHLAVVVDDALQGVTEVVRGYDLIDSTARQILLQQKLNYLQPEYAHIPLALNENGEKLSKQTLARAVCCENVSNLLVVALRFLGQQVPPEIEKYSPREIVVWGTENWSWAEIPKVKGKNVESHGC